MAAVVLRHSGHARLLTAVLSATLALFACSNGGESPAARPSTTSTAVPGVVCPDGSTVPDAAPVVAPAVAAPRPIGPGGRVGALDIGTLLPRTGDVSFAGAPALAGVELAVADLDAAGGVLGARVGLRHGDSAEGTPGTAEAEVTRLLDGGADVIVGPLSSSTAARVLDQVASGEALLVSPASTSSGLDTLDRAGRLFRTGPTEAILGRGLADLIVSEGNRTVSVAARDDEYGQVVANALVSRLEEVGASVTARADYDPSAPGLGEDVVDRLDTTADALVLVGLAESARVLDVLVADGEGPRARVVYGTDGNLGERLGDLLDDRQALACFRGLLPFAAPDAPFAERVRELTGASGGALDLAAESYDATVVAALAAATAGSDRAEAMAALMGEVTAGGRPCRDPQACLDLIAAGTDVSYVGETGRLALDGAGNRTEAGLVVAAFDDDGHLARTGSRRVGR